MKKDGKKVTHFIDLLQTEEVTALYKHFSGVTKVTFKDRNDAEVRLLNVTYNKPTPVMVQAFKAVGLDKATIDQYGTMLRGPIAFPEGQMTPKQLKAHQQALSAGQKIDKKDGAAKQPNASSTAILLAIRELIPVEAEGENAFVDTTKVAEKLGTNVNAVIKAAEQLTKQKLIEMEDDTPDSVPGQPASPLFWLSLLPAGRELEVTKTPAKLPASNPGPRSGFGGMVIHRLVPTNPRREGSEGWKSFNLIKDGMTFEDYRKAGGRNTDLAWDIAHGFTAVRAPGEEAPAKKKAEAAPAPKAPASAPRKEKAAPKVDPQKEMEELRQKLAEMEKREAAKIEKQVVESGKSPAPKAKKSITKKAVTPKKKGKK
jgi:hypothetical protein